MKHYIINFSRAIIMNRYRLNTLTLLFVLLFGFVFINGQETILTDEKGDKNISFTWAFGALIGSETQQTLNCYNTSPTPPENSFPLHFVRFTPTNSPAIPFSTSENHERYSVSISPNRSTDHDPNKRKSHPGPPKPSWFYHT